MDLIPLGARMNPEKYVEEPTGVLACSPEILRAAEYYALREWDGTEEDAEDLLRDYLTHPFV